MKNIFYFRYKISGSYKYSAFPIKLIGARLLTNVINKKKI